MTLNTREIVDHYPEVYTLQEGEEIHVNHVGCEAGSDTKKRLYVKRQGGVVLMYCHHCGMGGRFGSRRNHIRSSAHHNILCDDVHLPHDLVCRADMCNVHANVWLNKAGLTEEERMRYRIGWSESHRRVILPVRNYANTKIVAYQRRAVLPSDDLPKYLTTRRGDVKNPVWCGGQYRTSPRAVVCEDILSAVKVNRLEASYALLGTHMPDWLVFHMAIAHDEAVIWLDNDKPEVKAKQRSIATRLKQFMDKVVIVYSDRDPKLHSTDEIRKILDNL